MICGRCGAPLGENVGLCSRCGSVIGAGPTQPPYYGSPPGSPYGHIPPTAYPGQQPPPGYGPQMPPPYGPQQPGYAQFTPAQKPKKSWKVLVGVLVTVFAVIAALFIIGSLVPDDPAPTPNQPTAVDEPTNTPTPTLPARGEFTDYPITLGEGTQFPLKGVMSIPDNVEGRVPAVVFVHGDGIFDMDAAVGQNKAFKEIGDYLASYGIAVIRYDKRAFEYRSKMTQVYNGGVTAWESQMEDAILAAQMIKADPRVDDNQVFILGHSKGGCLAPRIHALGGDFAGIISMAGTPRAMSALAYNQRILWAMAALEGDQRDAKLTEYDNDIAALRETILAMDEEKARTEYWGGEFTYFYYQDYEQHLPTDYIKDISIPFLILQGEEDVQVSAYIDYPAWQDELAGRDNATFRLYEGLNHFFLPSLGHGDDPEAEYGTPAHVDDRFLNDIVEWIWSLV